MSSLHSVESLPFDFAVLDISWAKEDDFAEFDDFADDDLFIAFSSS